jgi:hypothetical protein
MDRDLRAPRVVEEVAYLVGIAISHDMFAARNAQR